MKYKKWIDDVKRVRSGLQTRFDKVRLDKNERLTHFPGHFWNNILAKITQEHVLAYPEVEPLYHKLSKKLGLTPDNLLITAGSDFAIKVAFDLFVNPGDEVIYVNPTFAMVDVYCGLSNAKKVPIGYDSNLHLEIIKLLNAVNENSALIIIANPNSPTGTYIDNNSIKEILDKAKRFSVPVLIDEAYFGFCPHTAINFISSFDNVMITRTFSKTAGMAGLRIGYIAAHHTMAKILYKFRPMYEVNSISVLIASELLDQWHLVADYIKATDEGKQYLLSELNALSFKTIDTYTNFIHVDFGVNRERILNGFQRDGILVRGSLDVKGFENYSRISVGNIDVMQKVVESIKKKEVYK